MEKPQIYWWEKVNLVDHKGQKALQIGSRRRRWFQMYKVHHWGRSVIYGLWRISHHRGFSFKLIFVPISSSPIRFIMSHTPIR